MKAKLYQLCLFLLIMRIYVIVVIGHILLKHFYLNKNIANIVCFYTLNMRLILMLNILLMLCISTKNTKCSKHKPRDLDYCTQNIQEWCEYCSEILQFKQIITNNMFGS